MEDLLLEVLTYCSNNGYLNEVKPFRNLNTKFRNDNLLWDTIKKVTNTNNMTFLMYASMTNDLPRVKFLLDRGSDVNIQDIYNRTPLYIVISNYKRHQVDKLNIYYDIIDVLVKNGANINIQCDEFKTVLMIAYHNRDDNTIMILTRLSYMIDYSLKDISGYDTNRYIKDYESWKD